MKRLYSQIDRRAFLKLLSMTAASGLAGACNYRFGEKTTNLIHIPRGQSVTRFPEKEELILLTDRPPQLETPLFYFREDLTPNDAFFVRWHFAGIPTLVDLRTFRLNVGGHVNKPLSLSMEDLKTQFEPHTVVAVVQCSGNSRSFFEPKVPGGQWQNGAMGNARWKGALLRDVLKKAGIKKGAVEAGFAGLDEPPLSNMPKFAKSLSIEHALEDNVLVAYEMNDEPLPMVNGFPLRLVVPGWFATYWVKSLAEINVLPSKFDGFWMEKSYRIPNNEYADESPDNPAKDTIPINKMNVRSLFVRPDQTDVLKAGVLFTMEGLAFDGGAGIKKVELSTDFGRSWSEARLISDLGKFAWYRWQYQWIPLTPGKYKIMVRAISNSGECQPATTRWNKSGYMRNTIESLEVTVV